MLIRGGRGGDDEGSMKGGMMEAGDGGRGDKERSRGMNGEMMKGDHYRER